MMIGAYDDDDVVVVVVVDNIVVAADAVSLPTMMCSFFEVVEECLVVLVPY